MHIEPCGAIYKLRQVEKTFNSLQLPKKPCKIEEPWKTIPNFVYTVQTSIII